jgi:putative ABC transport system permease protein
LSGLTVGVLFVAKVPQGRAVIVATLRAALQLAIVALALRGGCVAPIAIVGGLAITVSVAIWTASRRLDQLPGHSGRSQLPA